MASNEPRWVKKWNSWIAPTPSRPGVWRRKEGGYLVRGRARDPRTGKLREVKLTLADEDAAGAYRRLQEELDRLRSREAVEERPSASICFAEYSVSLLERKVRRGEIRSAKGREKWGYMLELHLLPFFGPFQVDQIRRADVERWKDGQACLIHAGKLSPGTANDRLSTLRSIINAAVGELELERNPVLGVKDFDTSAHPTYTEEEPNSLGAEEVPAFLAMMREIYPQHFALVALGFATGLRPSSMRPLRRKGESPDVLWDEGVLLVRRSHTRRQEVMPTTKTRRNQRLALPEEMITNSANRATSSRAASCPGCFTSSSSVRSPCTTSGPWPGPSPLAHRSVTAMLYQAARPRTKALTVQDHVPPSPRLISQARDQSGGTLAPRAGHGCQA
jgi:integrase